MNTATQRTILIKADTVRHFTRFSLNEIRDRADGDLFGGYVWVWNVAVDPSDEARRDLRFWAREVVAPETVRGWDLDRVLKCILPLRRANYPAGEVRDVVLGLSGQALMRLRSELNGQLAANSSFYTRAGLEKFLRARWVGSAQLSTKNSQPVGRAA